MGTGSVESLRATEWMASRVLRADLCSMRFAMSATESTLE